MRFLTSLLVVVTLCVHAVSGVPTMGPAGSNAEYKQLAGEGPQDTLRRALNVHGTVHILPGTYQFTAPLTGAFNNVKITGTKGAILKGATSGSVGLFNLSGDSIVIEGLTMISESFVADQRLVKIEDSSDPRISHCRIEMNTCPAPSAASPPATVGDTTTPMVAVEFEDCSRPRIDGNFFLPNHAWVSVLIDNGHGHMILNNHFSSDVEAGLGSADSPTSGQGIRLCYIGIHTQGAEWGSIMNNRFFGLGEGTGLLYSGGEKEVFGAIVVNGTGTITTNEQHHSQIIGNRIEFVNTTGAIRLYGVNSYTVATNLVGLLGYAQAAPNATGEAGIVISCKRTSTYSNDFATTSVSDTSYSVLVFGNDLHNNAESSSDGCSLYAEYCDELQVKCNRFAVSAANYYIWLNSATVGRPAIFGNSFSSEGGMTYAINLDNTGAIANGIQISGNTTENVVNLVNDQATAGASGRRKILTGIQDSSTMNDHTTAFSLSGTTVSATAATNTIADSGNGLGSLQPGDVIDVTGSSVSGNNRRWIVVTSAAGSIVVSPSGVLADDPAGDPWVIKRAGLNTNIKLDG